MPKNPGGESLQAFLSILSRRQGCYRTVCARVFAKTSLANFDRRVCLECMCFNDEI
jgi:hypothetical protein